jgi:D-sedoheptulose 7-phosphate isomerase
MGSTLRVRQLAEESLDYHRRFTEEMIETVARLADRVSEALEAGGKVLFFGNGGSASQAQHLAAELVNRFERDRPALPAVALTSDSAAVTSIANDDAYERVFSRQVEALGREGDVAIGLTTSGSSPNVVAGLRTARDRGMLAIAFSGRDGGEAARVAGESLVVAGGATSRIQEIHLLAGHILCALVEERLFPVAGGSAGPSD